MQVASKPFKGKSVAQRKAGTDAKAEDTSSTAFIRCCDSLSEGASFIPYRDAKLTRMFKTCLGGDGRGLLIGCVSVSPADFSETEAMLQFYSKCATGISISPYLINDVSISII